MNLQEFLNFLNFLLQIHLFLFLFSAYPKIFRQKVFFSSINFDLKPIGKIRSIIISLYIHCLETYAIHVSVKSLVPGPKIEKRNDILRVY